MRTSYTGGAVNGDHAVDDYNSRDERTKGHAPASVAITTKPHAEALPAMQRLNEHLHATCENAKAVRDEYPELKD